MNTDFFFGLLVSTLMLLQNVLAQDWPPISRKTCSQSTKLKAMNGQMRFKPSLKTEQMTSMEVDVEWNALEFHPKNRQKKGGVYVAYTMGMKDGPGGYFGVQIKKSSGQFIFSMWDADRIVRKDGRKYLKRSDKLAWPLDMENCQRNCQDCSIASLKNIKKLDLTTGTKCTKKHLPMKVGDIYRVKLERISKSETINTKDFGGFNENHKDVVLGENDRDVTGSVWQVSVIVIYGTRQGEQIKVGTILLESKETGFNRLGTFDEMLGCNKCNAIYHKDTRYGPFVGTEDGRIRKPVSMHGSTKHNKSRCKDYLISGSKRSSSISFESGPLIPFGERSTKRFRVW